MVVPPPIVPFSISTWPVKACAAIISIAIICCARIICIRRVCICRICAFLHTSRYINNNDNIGFVYLGAGRAFRCARNTEGKFIDAVPVGVGNRLARGNFRSSSHARGSQRHEVWALNDVLRSNLHIFTGRNATGDGKAVLLIGIGVRQAAVPKCAREV